MDESSDKVRFCVIALIIFRIIFLAVQIARLRIFYASLSSPYSINAVLPFFAWLAVIILLIRKKQWGFAIAAAFAIIVLYRDILYKPDALGIFGLLIGLLLLALSVYALLKPKKKEEVQPAPTTPLSPITMEAFSAKLDKYAQKNVEPDTTENADLWLVFEMWGTLLFRIGLTLTILLLSYSPKFLVQILFYLDPAYDILLITKLPALALTVAVTQTIASLAGLIFVRKIPAAWLRVTLYFISWNVLLGSLFGSLAL